MQDSEGKKVRRIAAIIYLLIMAFLAGGTYIHQQRATVGSESAPVTQSQPQQAGSGN
ncbi:MAG: hypothetical protein KGZ80_07880 [Methylomonas sp.]|nr:hypothetical protein [Methylomonas sp.]